MLLLYSRSIALWATPKNSPHIAGLNIHTEGMTRLAMAIIGLFLVASAFPEAGGGLIRLSIEALRSIKDPNHISFGESWIPGLPEQFAKLALGIALFLTAFRIAPFLRPLRRAGTGAHLDAPTSSSQSKERS